MVAVSELGPLQELVVGHDNAGQGPSWHLEQVDVTDVKTGQVRALLGLRAGLHDDAGQGPRRSSERQDGPGVRAGHS